MAGRLGGQGSYGIWKKCEYEEEHTAKTAVCSLIYKVFWR